MKNGFLENDHSAKLNLSKMPLHRRYDGRNSSAHIMQHTAPPAIFAYACLSAAPGSLWGHQFSLRDHCRRRCAMLQSAP